MGLTRNVTSILIEADFKLLISFYQNLGYCRGSARILAIAGLVRKYGADDVAKAVNLSPNTVRQHMYCGRKTAKKCV